jgi:hypothetical protein
MTPEVNKSNPLTLPELLIRQKNIPKIPVFSPEGLKKIDLQF